MKWLPFMVMSGEPKIALSIQSLRELQLIQWTLEFTADTLGFAEVMAHLPFCLRRYTSFLALSGLMHKSRRFVFATQSETGDNFDTTYGF